MNDEWHWLCPIPGLLRLTFTLYLQLLQKHFHSRDSYKTLYNSTLYMDVYCGDIKV